MKSPKVETALITGGGSGMGRASALALANAGIRVMIADLNSDSANETVGLIEESGGKATAFQVDVAESASVGTLFDQLRDYSDSLNMLIHTAAIMGETASLDEIADDGWRRMMAVNIDGAFYCCREAVRWMKQTGGGRIILFSSVASLTPTPGAIAYSASKGAVNMMAKSLAGEVAQHNIRVNAIAPGYVETPMLKDLPDGFDQYIIKKTPLKRLGRVEEVASLVAYLATPSADFITGQVISPNGGLVI